MSNQSDSAELPETVGKEAPTVFDCSLRYRFGEAKANEEEPNSKWWWESKHGGRIRVLAPRTWGKSRPLSKAGGEERAQEEQMGNGAGEEEKQRKANGWGEDASSK